MWIIDAFKSRDKEMWPLWTWGSSHTWHYKGEVVGEGNPFLSWSSGHVMYANVNDSSAFFNIKQRFEAGPAPSLPPCQQLINAD